MTAALTAEELQTAVLALSGVIALNIAATVAHHLTDTEKLREQAEEEAFSRVEDATLKQISSNAEQLAAKIAPMLAADWIQNTQARYLANLGSGQLPAARQIIDAKSQDAHPARNLQAAATPAPTLAQNLFKRVNLPRRKASRLKLQSVANLVPAPNEQSGQDLQ